MGRGTDVPGPDRGPRRRVEDSRNSVRLGEQRPVHRAEAHANTEPLQYAGDGGGRGQEEERVQIADEHSRQQNDGQLAAGRPHHRCVSVVKQEARDRHSCHDTQARDHRRGDRERAVPPDVIDRQLVATSLVLVRPFARPAVHAGVLVVHVLVLLALVAHPATSVTLLLLYHTWLAG